MDAKIETNSENEAMRVLLKELIDVYSKYYEKWVARFGTDVGFNEWLDGQLNI